MARRRRRLRPAMGLAAMTVVVTGSSGHLGEALVRALTAADRRVVGVDLQPGPYTHHVGTITERGFVTEIVRGARAVVHAATLHKPHVVTHDKRAFVDTNVTGTLNLLEEAILAGVDAFVFTSTTSAFGAALSPPPGAPAAWIDETVAGVPRNIYGVTKTVAEDLCQLFHRQHGLPCVVLRTSRFFPEDDDSKVTREAFSGDNAKANEFLFRRVDLEDAVSAHLAAVDRAPSIGFGKYVVSATTPFQRGDLALLRTDPARVVEQLFPACRTIYAKRGFRMSPSIDRVYANGRARRDLAWNPRFDFARILGQLAADEPIGSALAREVGSKGYHDETFDDGPFPVE